MLGIKKKIENWLKYFWRSLFFYKMNTDNDALLKFFISLCGLITKQVQSCNLQEDGRFFQI